MARIKDAGVYIIENLITNSFYIGSSVDMHARLLKHRRELQRGIHGNPHLQSAWNKYGADAFVFRVLEPTPEEEPKVAEQRYLDRFVGQDNCYNIAPTIVNGNKGRHLSDEHKSKIGAANKVALKGRKLAPHVYDAAARALREHRVTTHTQESRQKMRAAKLGKSMPFNSYPRTEETRARISATKRGIPWSAARRDAQAGKKGESK